MPKIAPEIQQEILDRVGSGATQDAVADWLRDAHGIEVSRQAISKMVQKHRSSLADVNKAVARTHGARLLATDLDAFERHRAAAAEAYEIASSDFVAESTVANADKMHKLGALLIRMEDVADRRRGLDQPDEKLTTLSALLARPPSA